ncbi:MAG TPA: NAD(P)/FAD-dependent oxidoreductase [Planosporangium sp.]|nr:NAD(P)/FAD-dependent oxidoreductase [Planosporangium sp.]
MSGPTVDVAVVGAGLAGLTAAFRLRSAGHTVEVFESADAVGGRTRTYRRDGYIVEAGTETLARHGYDSTWRLMRDVGLDACDALPVRSMAAVWRNGRPHVGVGHPLGMVTGAGLSLRGRLALTTALTSLVPRLGSFDVRRPGASALGDTTVAGFARGRHPDVLDYVLQPAVGTGWGWQPEDSCIAPLIATMLSSRGLTGWRTYRDGMDMLARRLADQVTVHTDQALVKLDEEPDGVRLLFQDGRSVSARTVLLAVPAPVALAVHPSMPAHERSYLAASRYTPIIRVTCQLNEPLALPRRRGQPDVYALLIPEREDGILGGLTIEHRKAANRARPGAGLVSLLSAPRVTADLMERGDEEVSGALLDRAERFLPGLHRACVDTAVHRFPFGAPQATPEALRLHQSFVDRPVRRVEYAGDWVYQRPSGEAAVQSAELAVSRLGSLPS